MKRFLCVVMAMLLFCTWAFAEEESVPGAEEVALGLQYENGDRVEQDYAKAMEYYLSAAEAGNGEGMRRVGRLYQYGNGVESDYALAMEWYVRGAEAGDAGSIRNIGYLYENGFGVEQDYAIAMEWYLKAAEAGEPKAMNDIGYLYENGLGVEQDYSLAMEWYLKAAETGNADAMCYIGWLYSFGLGVEQDDALAMEWYLRSAEAGSADAMFNAGVYYYLGRGVEQDVSLAMEWFLRAAEAGHASAMCNVGAAYANGEGVEQDPEKAAEWYRKSAEAGDARGMCLYAQKLEKGEGVEQDVKAAAEWYRKSAEAGDAEAMYYYALMLDDSEGVEKNAVIVAEWYLQAAEAGIPEAMYRYAQMLENGVGVEKNEELAQEWYDKAEEAGYIPPAFAQAETETDPAALLESMNTQQKIAQLLMPAFYYYVNDEGKTVSLEEIHPDIEAILQEYGFGGVIFNLQNAKDNEKAARLVDAMQSANASVPGRPQLLTFTDQEGGYVTRLAQGTQMPGNMALGAADDPAVTENTGFLIGQEVTAIGYSGAFAPVLDVNSNPANPVIGIRSFSDDPETVAEQGVAFMNGLRKAEALSALKHFPGHGDTDTDSHTGLPCVNKTYEELKAFELIPFQAAIDAGADMVMTAHIVYPQVETGAYTSRKTGEEIGLPATLSKTILTDILRGDMGFEGLIVSDAMNMDAIAAHFDSLDAARLAIEAGVDLILMPVDTSTPEGLAALKQYIQDVATMADSGTLSMEAVDDAVLRVLFFKEKHGMLASYVCEDLEAKVQQAVSTVGSQAHHETEFGIAKKAITLVKNEGVFPLNPEESVAVLVPYSSELMSAEYAVQRLKDEGKLSEDAPVSVLYLGNMTVNDLVKTAQKTKHLIVIHAAYSLNGMNPAKTNGSDSVIVEALLTLAHAAGSDVTVISAQLPYDAARFPDADAVIVAYGSRGMSEDPRNKEYGVSQYGPNLPAAVYMALSGQYMTGKLPVNIPMLNENCEYTDEILYPRGYSAALEELSERLKSFYSILVDGWNFLNEEGTSAAYGDGFLQATLEDTIAHAEPAPVTVTGRPEESVSRPEFAYDLSGAHEVDGRQGVAWEDSCFYISGSTTLTKYDADWNLIAAAENPFSGFSDEVNHIGDIDVYNGELYAGVEFFMDGEAKNIQIAVYDALTLELTRTYPFAGESGQNEVSGIAVDPDSGSIWLCSWADGESGRYLYRYDLNTGDYLGKFHLQAPPQWIQGVAYRDGWLYLTADDGTADLGEPDHVYRCRVDVSKTAWTVLLERTLDDVTLQGEIEGITFTDSQMLISYNRGTRIVLGMPKGFYEGYDQEIHEVFDYTMKVYDILRRGAN